MRAVIYHRHDDVRVEDVPTPAIAEGELLLRVAGCGLCGSDLLKLASHAPPPVKLGHELSGTVVASHSKRFGAGQRVVVAHHVPCGACVWCQRGSPTMCAHFKASNLDPCGLAEYVCVPAAHVEQTTLELPDDLPHDRASFTEPLACCLRAVGRADLAKARDVVVMGLGSMGLLLLQALRVQLPAAALVGIDPLPERRALARDLGADQALANDAGLAAEIKAASVGRGADLVVLSVGAPGALAMAQTLVRDGGELLVFAAQPGDSIAFDLWDCYHREVRLTTSYSSTPADLRAALQLLASGQVRVAPLISHRLPLVAFSEGVALARTHQALKVYFEMCV